ncbi:MAG: alanine racemase, partial [Oscillospiraceae bacterium]|nr:alanine racemase [Oscillospiraceae bacterium]
YANSLNRKNIPVNVHIKIDTGMHRQGIPFNNFSDVEKIFAMKKLNVCGIYTHLSCSDSIHPDDAAFTENQIDRFYNLIGLMKASGLPVPKQHIQSSFGLLNYPDLKCDYARIGIALYGVLSAPECSTALKPDLRPVLSLKARVALIQDVKKGENVGYGREFTAEKDSKIAILPIGYGDGFPRNLSCGKAYALIRDQLAPIVGRICMDQLAVDVTNIKSIVPGDTATLIGKDEKNELSAPVIAYRSGSISNELLCRMGSRLPITERRQ